MLVHAGKLQAKTAEDLVRQAREKKTSFVNAVIASGQVSPADLAHTLSSALALPLLDLSAMDPQRMPQNVVDAKLAQQYQVVALSRRGSRLFLGGADPTDLEVIERIKFATQLQPEWVIVEHDKLTKMLSSTGATATETLESIAGGDFDFDIAEEDATPQQEAAELADVEDAPVVRFLQKMLVDAINLRASDLHFEPYEFHYRVRFRVDGELREITQPPIAIKDKLSSRIKVISRLDIAERRVPQDGRMKLKFGTKSIDFRVSTLPTLFGEKIVIRILDSSSAKLGIEALGYEKIEKERLLAAIYRPYGMVLVTGPTGSGKTVSLYTCLNILNQPGVNISTVEDPAEINLPGINQVNVNDKAGLNFSAALKSFLRQDPDIIMVGEIRDGEVAETAINAALTGHLVFSTLHTNDAAGAFPRLIDLGIDEKVLSSAINAVLAQRLLRKLCEKCKTERAPTPEEQAVIDKYMSAVVDQSLVPAETKKFWAAKEGGCEACHGRGYKGRIGIFEAVFMDTAIETILRSKPSEREIFAAARPQGIPSLQEDGVIKVLRGVTSLEELQRVVDLGTN